MSRRERQVYKLHKYPALHLITQLGVGDVFAVCDTQTHTASNISNRTPKVLIVDPSNGYKAKRCSEASELLLSVDALPTHAHEIPWLPFLVLT